MTALTSIEAVWIDNCPFSQAEPVLVDSEVAILPKPFLDALFGLYDSTDSVRCARCDDPAGFVLQEHSNGFESVVWVPTGLAREGDGPVVVLCGECAPYVPELEPDGAR